MTLMEMSPGEEEMGAYSGSAESCHSIFEAYHSIKEMLYIHNINVRSRL